MAKIKAHIKATDKDKVKAKIKAEIKAKHYWPAQPVLIVGRDLSLYCTLSFYNLYLPQSIDC